RAPPRPPLRDARARRRLGGALPGARAAGGYGGAGLSSLRPERRRPLREDGAQRHRVRAHGGLRRGPQHPAARQRRPARPGRGRALRALRLERRGRLPGPPAVGDAIRVRRPPREAARSMSAPRSDAVVFFGASGDPVGGAHGGDRRVAGPDMLSRRPKVLVIDVGGTHVKVLASGRREPREIPSGPSMDASGMVAAVKRLTADWRYDVVSIGYPGVVVHGRPVAAPYNLGR